MDTERFCFVSCDTGSPVEYKHCTIALTEKIVDKARIAHSTSRFFADSKIETSNVNLVS